MQPDIHSLAPKPASLEELIQKAKTFVAAAKAPATLKAYRNDWRDFESWCREHQLPSLPSTPEAVALYIADRASTLASGTIARRLTSITKAHQSASFTDSPASTRHFIVGETLKGIRRTIGTAQHGKAPLLSDDVRRIVAARREDLLGLRDAALVLVGFAGGFRRAELAGIDTCDLKFSADGVVVTVRKSKTDQEGAGREVGLPFGASHDTCPVRALRQWLDKAGITEGPVLVFRAGSAQFDEQLIDGIACHACHSARGTDAVTFHEAGYNLTPLIYTELVHDLNLARSALLINNILN